MRRQSKDGIFLEKKREWKQRAPHYSCGWSTVRPESSPIQVFPARASCKRNCFFLEGNFVLPTLARRPDSLSSESLGGDRGPSDTALQERGLRPTLASETSRCGGSRSQIKATCIFFQLAHLHPRKSTAAVQDRACNGSTQFAKKACVFVHTTERSPRFSGSKGSVDEVLAKHPHRPKSTVWRMHRDKFCCEQLQDGRPSANASPRRLRYGRSESPSRHEVKHRTLSGEQHGLTSKTKCHAIFPTERKRGAICWGPNERLMQHDNLNKTDKKDRDNHHNFFFASVRTGSYNSTD